jgi:hypothetical protein
MAMEIIKVVPEAHDSPISSIAYNKTLKELYSSADGDKVIKVGLRTAQTYATQCACPSTLTAQPRCTLSQPRHMPLSCIA